MKKSIFLAFAGLLVILFYACKKDKSDPPDGGGVEYTTTDVQVNLPAGTSLDLSKTKIFTLSGIVNVGADGKAAIPFLAGSGQLAFLFDEADNLILASYITANKKEISIKTTAQALLFQGLQLVFQPDSAKVAFLERSATSPNLAGYFTKMEQAFKADPLMLEKRTFKDILTEAIGLVNRKPIDIYAKQIHIVDDDVKSKIEIQEVDVENVNIVNTDYRRSHAFIYKTAFKDLNNLETVLITKIDFDDAAQKNMKVERIKFIPNAFDQIGVAQGFKPATTGPVNLLLSSSEKEATYKIRVIGPGKPVTAGLTDAEKAKLEELYYEHLAYDILAPMLLDALGYKSLTSKINEEALRPFFEKVKIIAQGEPEVMENLKKGNFRSPVERFYEAVDATNQGATLLNTSLMDCMKAGYANEGLPFPSAETIQNSAKQMDKGVDLLKFLVGMADGNFNLAPHDYYNEMEEFEVKSRDNNVKLTPKSASVSTLTNQPFTANPNVDLNNGQTMWYKWRTTGKFGVLKTSGQEGATIETDQATINYYGNKPSSQLDENNIDQVFVTAYIKEGTGLTEVGSDTATVNVKKNQLVMRPDDAVINMKTGGQSSVKLYLLKSDGTKDILPNPVFDYKIVWSTAGTYGTLSGKSTSVTTYDDNTMVYTAFDEEVKNATENITAMVYFKGKTEATWYLRQEVKGKVKIDNDPKKIVYYTAPQSFHSDRGGKGCAVGCGVVVKKVNKAISYDVQVDGIESKLYPDYHDSWSATETDLIRGYMGYVLMSNAEAGGNFITGVYGTFTWAGGPGPDHFPIPTCTGTARVTVTVSE